MTTSFSLLVLIAVATAREIGTVRDVSPVQTPGIQVNAGGADSDSALPVIREMLESKEPEIRVEGLRLLDRAPADGTVDLIYKALFHADAEVRAQAVEGLRRVSGEALVSRILDTLHSGSMFEIQVVEEELPRLQSVVEQPLIDAVLEVASESSRRVLAAYALGCMKAPAAIEHLARLVWEDDGALAMASIQALGRMRTPETLPFLQSMLGHSSDEIRWEAVHGLGNLRTRESLRALVAVATGGRESSAMIQRQALVYLGASDRPEAIPMLIECMQYSQSLRDVAGEALHRLTGRRYGPNAVEWRRWYDEERRRVNSPEELLYSYKVRQAAESARQPQLQGEIVVESSPE